MSEAHSLESKVARATIIIHDLQRRAETDGRPVPASGERAHTMARKVVAPEWTATLTEGRRCTVGFVYGRQRIGERNIPAPGWLLVQLEIANRLVLVANVKGDEVVLHRFHPGAWEAMFGASSGGDMIAIEPVTFAPLGTPQWDALLAQPDMSLPPLREAPEDVSEHSAIFTKGRRRRRHVHL